MVAPAVVWEVASVEDSLQEGSGPAAVRNSAPGTERQQSWGTLRSWKNWTGFAGPKRVGRGTVGSGGWASAWGPRGPAQSWMLQHSVCVPNG